jgi:hypothetical protein
MSSQTIVVAEANKRLVKEHAEEYGYNLHINCLPGVQHGQANGLFYTFAFNMYLE